VVLVLKDINDELVNLYAVFGPVFQTANMDYKVLSVYNNIGTFDRARLWWGWRVNIFCPSEDQGLFRECNPAGNTGVAAYEWDTLCKDGRCPCDTRNEEGKCNADGIKNDPKKSYVNVVLCDFFFNLPTLDSLIESGKSKQGKEKYDLDNYWNSQSECSSFSPTRV
jgi:hypothetical protein